MLKDKYNMTTEENVLYAKRNIVDSIWKSANLEGISSHFQKHKQYTMVQMLVI